MELMLLVDIVNNTKIGWQRHAVNHAEVLHAVVSLKSSKLSTGMFENEF